MDRLDGTAVRSWAHAATVALGSARARIDAMNVFPVADADTGTNALLTVAGGAEAVASVAPGAGADAVARAFAHGALLSARGNSGVILSQYLEGLAAGLPADAGPGDLARALVLASRAADSAVADPQEGTVLTVARVIGATATLAADAGACLEVLLDDTLRDAHDALGSISARHPVLRAAHVADAGACALLVVLDALGRVVAGRAHEPVELAWLPSPSTHPHTGLADGGAFEVMLLVRADDGSGADLAPLLSARMQAVGDSVAVVGADGMWHVHVHTDTPAQAIADAALARREQVVVRLLAGRAAGESAIDPVGARLGVVACTTSPELGTSLALSGAVTLVRCDGAALLVRHLVRAITDAGETHVVVLPGDEQTAEAARAAAHALAPIGTRVDVLDALDELQVAVAALALQGGGDGTGRVVAAAAALGRLRTTIVAEPDLASACAAVDALVAGTRSAAPTLTVLVGATVDDTVRAAFDADVALRHPDVAVLGPAVGVGGPAFWLGLD